MSKNINFSDRLAERMELHKNLPLSCPLTIQIWVSDICNFRCKYCVQSDVSETKNDYISFKLMELSAYKRVIDNIKELGHLKKLMLFGNGEPLCHPDFVEMVRYAKAQNVADIVETFSNGALLTHELSLKLIDSGLDRLKISLQGLSSEDYKKVANVDLDYEKFVSEIRYFYENKQNCILQVKIIDELIPTEEEQKLFRDIYTSICDELLVESLMNLSWGTPHKDPSDHAVFGNKITNAKICSRPFFNLHINADGNVRPCCFAPMNFHFGSAIKSLKDIWNGRAYNEFLCDLLSENKKAEPCKSCVEYSYLMMDSDILDGHQSELLKRYKNILKGLNG